MPAESADQTLMRRALDLAMQGRGSVEPNPMVGCVIVRDGRVIGEGFHQQYGGPHAEPRALDACTEDPAGATAYVTLEPCCHHRKQTPPCVPRLIAARLSRIVVACEDPNPQVSGRGITQLRQAGITVETGILADESRQLCAPFFKQIGSRRPYVTLKWAQSANGKVAGRAGARLAISNAASQAVVHQLRARCDAILVGIGTVLTDDPLLTPRGVAIHKPPIRAVLDTHLRTPPTSQLARTVDQSPVVIFRGADPLHERRSAAATLRAMGVELVSVATDGTDRLSLPAVLDHLGERGITHLLVEPGPTLADSFIQQNLADRAWVFQSPKIIAESTAPSAPSLHYPHTGERQLGEDRLMEHLNPKSPVFFSMAASADLRLVR